MRVTPGTRLGPYEILAPLGAGGMGEVYRARDSRLGRDVALKVLPEAVASRPDRLARFEREARTIAALNHPSIVTLHSIEEHDGVRLLTMELVEGESLDRLVAPGGLPPARVGEIALALAEALVVAHEKGIVHRDLKPGNVMVTPDGRVKVLDFGLAKLAADEGDAASETLTAAPAAAPLTQAGQVMGTVPYMAPEQLRGEPVDGRTDLFALGVILYELIAGRRPFEGKSASDTISSILRDPPPPLASARGDVPPDLGRIVARCLEKDPEHRFQTAKDARSELRLLQREASRASDGALAPGRGGSGASAAAPESRRLRRRRLAGRWLRVLAIVAAIFLARSIWFSGRREAPPPPAVPAAPAVASIAVLPFADLSPRHDQEYFADGMSEELLNVLARLRDVRVAARTSSFSFKGKEVQIPEVGRQLHVDHVLEGSVRKAGDRYRITAQLVQTSDGFQIWSETFDLDLGDVFAVQDRIAQAVVRELRVALGGARGGPEADTAIRSEIAAAATGRGSNAEAYRLFMQGRFFYDRFNESDMAKAIDLLGRATTLDPTSAVAWAALSRARMAQASWGWAPAGADGFARARAAAERALSLEPDLAEGHVALGWVALWHDWDWAAAEASYRRAEELAPGNADVLHAVAGAYSAIGNLSEAIALDRRAVALDPLSVPALRNLASHAYEAGDLAAAEEALARALELGPENGFLPYGLGLVRLAQGRAADALASFEKVPVDYYRLQGTALARHALGDRAGSDAALRRLIAEHGKESLYQIAQVYAYRGEADRAFDWLDRAYRARDPGLAEVKVEPFFRGLRDDRRWAAFLKRMGFAA